MIDDSACGLAAVEQEIARACADARRERSEVTLIAVSKTFFADAITPVLAAGQRHFGENRVQEPSRNGRRCAKTIPAPRCI